MFTKRSTILLAPLAAIVLFLLPVFTVPALGNSGTGYAAHYIVFEKEADGAIRPLFYRPVQLSGDPTGLSAAELAAALAVPDRNAEHLAVTLTSGSGAVLFRSAVDAPRWLRGEFHGATPGDPIEAHIWPVDRPVFVVRVPAIPGATLVLADPASGRPAQFDLDQLARTAPRSELPQWGGQSLSVQATGDPANRVDLLVLGDGYTAAQQAKFNSDAAGVLGSFFGITPYQEYRNYVNTATLFTASQQAGADHPPYQAGCVTSACCADATMLTDPLAGAFVNTAFDATFCYYNIHRLIGVNTSKVYAAAAAAPDWDEILVIVNDTTYGGSGGAFATVSMHSSAPQIAIHEYAHSFADLADEYDDPYPGYPACSDKSGFSPCEANVTDVTVRDQIKWRPWISDSTPIPTVPEDAPQWANVVGLFEGARYQRTGLYRSGQNCIMRALGRPFCQVPGQAYILKLYTGGWGVPAAGIRLIEPGSATPAASSITLLQGHSQTFHADILAPAGGPAASIFWLVDNSPVLNADSDTFVYTPDGWTLGNVAIELWVNDPTPLVNSDMAGEALWHRHAWTVNVIPVVEYDYFTWLPIITR